MDKLRLDRRPEARAFSVESLLQLVRDGKVRVPDFQRPLRWRATHVVDLFDSVYRGFPVGDLLLFKRPADAGLLHVGPVDVQAPAVPDAYFVVDGQQRITALAAAMLHPEPRPRADIYSIWFDLERESFLCAQSIEAAPEWIPVNTVGDSFALLNWLNAWPFRALRPDLVQRAIALGKALREYPIPAYIVEGASDSALRLIFKRVNTSGVAMQESEVFEALFGAGNRRPIESACARIQGETGFGSIPRETFLRCLEAIEGLDLRQTITEREDDATTPRGEAVERTERALVRAVQFLADDAGVVHRELLPYEAPLVLLSRFFDLHPFASGRTRTLLVRWFWRAALSETPMGRSDASVQALVSLMDEDEASSANRLLGTIPKDIELPLSVTAWRGNAAKTLAVAIALVHLSPRDPATGEPLRIDDIKALLDEKAVGDVFLDVSGDGGGTLAHRFLLPHRASLKKLPGASLEVLTSHALEPDAAEALAAGDLAAFAKRRGRVLDRWLRRFFAGRIGGDDADRPAVAELVHQVELAFGAP